MASTYPSISAQQLRLTMRRPARTGFRPQDKVKDKIALATLWPMMVILYSTMVPPEVRLQLGGFVLFPYRIALMITFPWLARVLVTQGMRLRFPDWLMLATGGWMLVVMIAHYGLEGIERGGALVFDMLMPYFVARMSIRSTADVKHLLLLLLPAIMASAAIMMTESVTRTLIVKPIVGQIFGYLEKFDGGETNFGLVSYRLGLLRSAGPFSHPILGGLYMASFLALFVKASGNKLVRVLGIPATMIGAFFSLSSAAFLAFGLCLGLLIYDWLQKRVEVLTWGRLLSALGVAVVCLQLISSGGIARLVIRYLTLNPGTGFYRILIWDYGTASVERHPIMGIALELFERPNFMSPTVDNNWLLQAMRYGLPGALPYYAAVIGIIVLAAMSAGRSKGFAREVMFGLALSLAVLTLAGATVAFFGSMQIWFTALLGIAMALAARIMDVPLAQPGRLAKAPDNRRGHPAASTRTDRTKGFVKRGPNRSMPRYNYLYQRPENDLTA